MLLFTDELILKAKEAKSVEELLVLAKENNVELTEEEAKEYFTQLNQKSGELSDEELDNVAGGACTDKDGNPSRFGGSSCVHFKYKAGQEYKVQCGSCIHAISTGKLNVYCTHPSQRK